MKTDRQEKLSRSSAIGTALEIPFSKNTEDWLSRVCSTAQTNGIWAAQMDRPTCLFTPPLNAILS